MPAFARIDKLRNRSQHNLLAREQEEDEQEEQDQQQAEVLQASTPALLSRSGRRSSGSAGGGAGADLTAIFSTAQQQQQQQHQQQHQHQQPQQQPQQRPFSGYFQVPLSPRQPGHEHSHQVQAQQVQHHQAQALASPHDFGVDDLADNSLRGIDNNTSTNTKTHTHTNTNNNTNNIPPIEQHSDSPATAAATALARRPLPLPLPLSPPWEATDSSEQAPSQARHSPSRPNRYSQARYPLEAGRVPANQATSDLDYNESPIAPIALSHSHTATVEPKRSARKLFKNILAAAASSAGHRSWTEQSHYYQAQDQHHGHQHHNSYCEGTTPPLPKYPTRTSSHLPASIKSFEQHVSHPDWAPPSQGPGSSPVKDWFGINADSDHRLQKTHSKEHRDLQPAQQPSIRHIPNSDKSPYQVDEIGLQIGQPIVDPAQLSQSPQLPQYQQPLQPDIGALSSHHRESSSDTASPLQESPTTDSAQRSGSAQPASSSVALAGLKLLNTLPPRPGQPSPLSPWPSAPHRDIPPSPITPNMAPPPGSSTSNRRPLENDKRECIQPPPGPPPNYRHSQHTSVNSMSPHPPTPANAAAAGTPNYRASNVPDRQGQSFDGSAAEAGRNSPQLSTLDRDGADVEKQFKDLLTKYKNVKRLYFDGKQQIEQLTSQVEQLQNAVANQRISQSRTALDDNEYTTRFNRLNGAINNLSFNIRKDWRTLPTWVEPFVSQDALKTGKQEMTAVGRAIIIHWVVEEVFNGCFHPGLDATLSRHLKEIEQNIRRFSYTLSSQEEHDALTSKVVSWRMSTLEGLQGVLQSSESAQHRSDFTATCAANLTSHLHQHLAEPPPPGVDGSVAMIIELAVGLAASLPMESRDVAITYAHPGDPIQPELMETEKTGLPPLPEPDDAEDSGKDNDKKREKPSKSASPPARDSSKVRLAAFVAVEVRGRGQVLVKAPIWPLA